MMLFFDTNVLIYALCKNIDDKEQQTLSIKLFEKAIINKELILSELILCEFAFIAKKLQEDEKNIVQYLKFLSRYVIKSSFDMSGRILEILEKTKLYSSSFDISHLVFCEYHDCKLITFDKGYKKLQNISKIEIDIK
jgi:predicted nucleic acid-binding protein